jgi:hypothetical protein
LAAMSRVDSARSWGLALVRPSATRLAIAMARRSDRASAQLWVDPLAIELGIQWAQMSERSWVDRLAPVLGRSWGCV